MANKPAATKTYLFYWEGKGKKGEKLSGELEAASMPLAKAALRKQGIQPKVVRKRSNRAAVGKKITPQDISVFSRQMATMMSSGIPLVQSFDIVGRGHSNPSMYDLVMAIKASVEGGSTFAESMAKHPKYFNDLFCSLIHAGEQSGALEGMLDRVATYMEKTESMKAKIKKAMIYPISVVVVAFIVTAILLIFVVPQFESMFKGFGADLPAATQFVVDASKFFQDYWYIVFGSMIGAAISFVQLKRRSEAFNEWWDRAILKFPVFGEILRNAIVARFARTLAVTFSAGLPLVEALKSVSGATGNRVYIAATQRIIEDISTGQQLQSALRNTRLFPNMMLQLVAIGEESGSLEKMLSKVADFYEEVVDNAVDNLSSLMEPFILVFLGGLVGGLVVSMYLPIFKMGSVV